MAPITLDSFKPYAATKRLVSPYLPGAAMAAIIAMAATFVSEHNGGPVMFYALLMGMALGSLADNPRVAPGIQLCSRDVLRIGVALLGLRVTFSDITALGFDTAILVMTGVACTILIGIPIGRLFGLRNSQALLSAGAVAICGASAALAIASVMPRSPQREKDMLVTVVGVTTLSTIAMVVYPTIARALDMPMVTAGIFLGATIHDVAQVIGAGYSISETTGETAAVVKLLRVSCLLPTVLLIGLAYSRSKRRSDDDPRPVLVPGFLIGFAVLATVHSLGWLPHWIEEFGGTLSRWCLVTAVAALGLKTTPAGLIAAGPRPVAALVAQTLLLATVILIGVTLFGIGS